MSGWTTIFPTNVGDYTSVSHSNHDLLHVLTRKCDHVILSLMNTPTLLTVAQASDRLAMTPREFRRVMNAGKIRVLYVNKYVVRVPEESIGEFITDFTGKLQQTHKTPVLAT